MSQFSVVGGPYPFARSPDTSSPVEHDRPNSTVEGLARVRFANFDLKGKLAYPNHEFVRVLLARGQTPQGDGGPRGDRRSCENGRSRDCILVFKADDRAIEHAGGPLQGQPYGVLRPVQSYVLAAGIERAAELEERLERVIEGEDRWGFALVRRSAGERPAAVTPPILEQLGEADLTRDIPGALRELILCDGTHRVVDAVWNHRRALPAVAVVGEPVEPYYAYPRSAFAWERTASNVLQAPPARRDRYRVREVDLDSLEPSARALFDGAGPSERYRRHFRDLTTGFGYMGEQGGREAAPVADPAGDVL